MIYRLAGSHFTLALITISILIGCAGVMTEQVVFLKSNYHMNFILDEIELETNIVILIAAFGIFLEYRHWLLERNYPDGIPEDIDKFDKNSHDISVLLILIAILAESVDLFFIALNHWGIAFTVLKYTEISILFFANITAIALIGIFGLRLLRK